MLEVKADAFEQSFEAFEHEDDGVAALKAELETLKAKIASGVIQAQRPVLDGVKSIEASSFDQYIPRGITRPKTCQTSPRTACRSCSATYPKAEGQWANFRVAA